MPASYIVTSSCSRSVAPSTLAKAMRATGSSGSTWRPFSPRPMAPADHGRPGWVAHSASSGIHASSHWRGPSREKVALHHAVVVHPADGAAEPSARAEVDVDVDRPRLLALGDGLDHLGDGHGVVGQRLPEPPAEPSGREYAASPLGAERLVGSPAAQQVAQQPVADAPLLEVVELDRQPVGDLLPLVEAARPRAGRAGTP